MDPFSQAALGAAIGQAGFQKRLGRRAIGWGAVLAALPDLDVIVRFSSDPLATIYFHRGITHSIVLAPLYGLILGYLLWRYYMRKTPDDPGELSSWLGLAILAIATHPILDFFTIYGTQLLAPFSNFRFYVPGVSVVDPVYTLTLLVAIAFGLWCPKKPKIYMTSAAIALSLTTTYLFYGIILNAKAEDIAKTQLAERGVTYQKLEAYNSIFQQYLRRVVVHRRDEVWLGYISTWKAHKISWIQHKKEQGPAAKALLAHHRGQAFAWFTNQDYLIKKHTEGGKTYIEMHDLRIGTTGKALWGMWKLQAEIDEKGSLITEPTRINIFADRSWDTIKSIFQATFTDNREYITFKE